MKAPSKRTKVVIRRLPPSLTQSDLFLQIDDKFSGQYNWFSFRPGKSSQKHQSYSRAYINFKRPEDVFKFAEFFDGHVFVNEKGAQHKIVVEYAPSQRVPKPTSKKDGREGTIYKDPDYLEFLKFIAKPPEHLPSAEIQLERKEAEQAGAAKEAPIVTPLMEFVRQKRAVESGPQGSSAVGKIRRRARAASPSKPRSSTTKRGSEKKKYILKESAKTTTQKDKSTFIVIARREDQQAISIGKGTSENEMVCGIDGSASGIPVTADTGKKKFLLLKGKERGAPEGLLQKQSVTPPAAVQPQQKIQILNSETGKRPPRPVNARIGPNGLTSKNEPNSLGSEGDPKRTADDKFTKKDIQGLGNVSEKRTRNRDRPDRGVWTPLRRSDVSNSIDEHSSPSDSIEASQGEMKDLHHGGRTAEVTTPASGRNSLVENGSNRHVGRRGAIHTLKDDGSLNMSEGKSSRRGPSGHSAYEKQVWVQKSSSGS